MTGEKSTIRERIMTNKDRNVIAIKYTFIIGLIAHAFAFLHLQVTHDSLGEFYLYDELFESYKVYEWKIALGRFMNPVFRILFQDEILRPWVLGLFGLLCIGLSVCLVIDIFSIEDKWEIMIISGVFTTNITVISCVATYMEDFAVDMMALFFAVFTAYIWKELQSECGVLKFVVGIMSVILMLGCYQSYLAVTIILIIISSVLDLLKGKLFENVFKNGLNGIGMIGLGAVGYLAAVKIVCYITGVPLYNGGYNSLSNMWTRDVQFWNELIALYNQTITDFLSPSHILQRDYLPALTKDTAFLYFISMINIVLLVCCLLVIFCWIISTPKKIIEKLLLGLLIGLMPLAMNISDLLSGTSHDLMHYAYWLFYLFALLLFRWSKEHKSFFKANIIQRVVVIALGVTIFDNVQISNTIYVEKELVQESTLSTITRVLAQIEEQEGYVLGETPVAFIGSGGPVQKGVPGIWKAQEITGGYSVSSITYQQTYKAYFENVLQYPIQLCDLDELNFLKESEEVKQMPVFPNKGSVQSIGNVIVVKMCNY